MTLEHNKLSPEFSRLFNHTIFTPLMRGLLNKPLGSRALLGLADFEFNTIDASSPEPIQIPVELDGTSSPDITLNFSNSLPYLDKTQTTSSVEVLQDISCTLAHDNALDHDIAYARGEVNYMRGLIIGVDGADYQAELAARLASIKVKAAMTPQQTLSQSNVAASSSIPDPVNTSDDWEMLDLSDDEFEVVVSSKEQTCTNSKAAKKYK